MPRCSRRRDRRGVWPSAALDGTSWSLTMLGGRIGRRRGLLPVVQPWFKRACMLNAELL